MSPLAFGIAQAPALRSDTHRSVYRTGGHVRLAHRVVRETGCTRSPYGVVFPVVAGGVPTL